MSLLYLPELQAQNNYHCPTHVGDVSLKFSSTDSGEIVDIFFPSYENAL